MFWKRLGQRRKLISNHLVHNSRHTGFPFLQKGPLHFRSRPTRPSLDDYQGNKCKPCIWSVRCKSNRHYATQQGLTQRYIVLTRCVCKNFREGRILCLESPSFIQIVNGIKFKAKIVLFFIENQKFTTVSVTLNEFVVQINSRYFKKGSSWKHGNVSHFFFIPTCSFAMLLLFVSFEEKRLKE